MATLSDVYAHLKTLCEQWFYNKSTMDTYLANKANSSHTHGNITNDGKIGATAAKPLITGTGGVVQAGSFGTTSGTFCQGNDSRLSNARTPTAHNQGSDTITEANALSNLGTSSGATQQAVNNAINTAIGNLSSIDAVNIVTTLPTASSSTLGKLYIISENSKVNVYYTEENNGTYSWEKLDDDILDELSVSWSAIKNKPAVYTPSSHSHGDISNTGAISSSTVSCTNSDYPIIATYSNDWKLKRTTAISAQMVSDFTAHSNIGTSARSVQSLVNSKIDDAIGNLLDSVDGKRNIQRSYTNDADDTVEEGHYYKLGGIVNDGQNQGMSFLDVMVDDYDRLVQVCYEYDYGEVFDNDVHQYIRYSTNLGSTWSTWKRFVEEDEFTTALNGKASSSHNHGNLLNGGTITQTVSNGGNLVVTNSNNAVGVQSTIDVLDGVIQDLISYGAS